MLLLLRTYRGKGKFLSCRAEDLKGLFHARFSQLLCVSQHTSHLDWDDFFINGNVLSSLALIFFGCVVGLHYIVKEVTPQVNNI